MGASQKGVWASIAMIALSVASLGIGTAFGLTSVWLYGFASAVTLGGGMIISRELAAAQPKTPSNSQVYSWNPQTTQRSGGALPKCYGRNRCHGNVIACYTSEENTLSGVNIIKSEQKLNLLIDFGEGPVEGLIADGVLINGQPADYWSGVTTEFKRGTLNQTACTAFADELPIEIPIGLPLTYAGGAKTHTTPDKHFDDLEIVIEAPEGIWDRHQDGDTDPLAIGIKIELSVHDADSWTTLVEDYIRGYSFFPVRVSYRASETYTGGAPVTIVRGNQYDVRITKTTADYTTGWRATSHGETLNLYAIREIIEVGFTYPGRVLLAVSALATKDLSGSLDVSAEFDGAIVNTDMAGGTTLEYSNNPAHVLFDMLTQPVISGDGDGTPYAIAEYTGPCAASDPVLSTFAVHEAYADALVDDGAGGTEARLTFDGFFDEETTVGDAITEVCAVSRCHVVWRGKKPFLQVDAYRTPVAVLSDGNCRRGSALENLIPSSERAAEVEIHYRDALNSYERTPLLVRNSQMSGNHKITLQVNGVTKQSRAVRLMNFELKRNQYVTRQLRRTMQCDGFVLEPGDVVYAQRPRYAWGGRLQQVSSRRVRLDREVRRSKSDRIIVQVYNPATESWSCESHLVYWIEGRTLQITDDWTIAPHPGDVYLFGPAGISNDLFEVTSVRRRGDLEFTIDMVTYDGRLFDADDVMPALVADVGVSRVRRAQRPAIAPASHARAENANPPGAQEIIAGVWDGQVVTHYSAAPPLVAHFKLNDAAANTDVADATGNGHDATASRNTEDMSVTGKISTALSFNGADDYVNIPAHADLRLTAGGTIMAWIKPNTVGETAGRIVDKSTTTTGSNGYLFSIGSSGKLTFRVSGGISISPAEDVTYGEWQHVAIAFDGVRAKFFVDGAMVSDQAYATLPPDVAGDVRIGNRAGATDRTFDGAIDDVRIYSRALTQAEILRIFNHGDGTEEVKVPDRGDLWIKSSEDNKPYQWTGSAWQAAGYDVATWAKVVGTGKPADNADVTADSPILTFRETFENPNDDYLDKWSIASIDEPNAIIVAEEGVAGGNVLQIGDNSGVDDTVNIRYHKKFAYDPTKLYRLRIRVKRTAGTGVLYFGVCAYTSALAANNPTGYTAHWVTAYKDNPDSDWEVFTGYFSGLSASANGLPSSDPASPAPLKDGTAYFDFFGRINYRSGGAQGIYKIDEIVLDILPEDADQIAESSTKKWAAESGADVTANHQDDINIDNIQDGSSYKKLSAANLAALQSAINVDTPQPRSGWEGAFTSNSPSAGYVAWTGFVIRYQGTDYTVAASNSNKKYLYWNAGGTKTQLYATDAIGDALGTGKFIVGYNDSGTFYPAQFIKIIHGALIQAATILAEHLSVSQLSAIVADLGEVTAGTITLNLGGDNRLKISADGIQGSNNAGSSYFDIIATDTGEVVITGDVIKAGSIVGDAIADDEITVFRSANTAAATGFRKSPNYDSMQSVSFPATGGVVDICVQLQLKSDNGAGDVVNWKITRDSTDIVSGTQAITNAYVTYTFRCIDIPSSGSRTYYMKVQGVVAEGDAQNRILYCKESIK